MLFNGTGPSSKLLLTVENGGFENAHFLQDFADWENLMSIPAAPQPTQQQLIQPLFAQEPWCFFTQI